MRLQGGRGSNPSFDKSYNEAVRVLIAARDSKRTAKRGYPNAAAEVLMNEILPYVAPEFRSRFERQRSPQGGNIEGETLTFTRGFVSAVLDFGIAHEWSNETLLGSENSKRKHYQLKPKGESGNYQAPESNGSPTKPPRRLEVDRTRKGYLRMEAKWAKVVDRVSQINEELAEVLCEFEPRGESALKFNVVTSDADWWDEVVTGRQTIEKAIHGMGYAPTMVFKLDGKPDVGMPDEIIISPKRLKASRGKSINASTRTNKKKKSRGFISRLFGRV